MRFLPGMAANTARRTGIGADKNFVAPRAPRLPFPFRISRGDEPARIRCTDADAAIGQRSGGRTVRPESVRRRVAHQRPVRVIAISDVEIVVAGERAPLRQRGAETVRQRRPVGSRIVADKKIGSRAKDADKDARSGAAVHAGVLVEQHKADTLAGDIQVGVQAGDGAPVRAKVQALEKSVRPRAAK